MRGTPRQVLGRHPHRRLLRVPLAFAHRHRRQCSTRDRSCRSVTMLGEAIPALEISKRSALSVTRVATEGARVPSNGHGYTKRARPHAVRLRDLAALQRSPGTAPTSFAMSVCSTARQLPSGRRWSSVKAKLRRSAVPTSQYRLALRRLLAKDAHCSRASWMRTSICPILQSGRRAAAEPCVRRHDGGGDVGGAATRVPGQGTRATDPAGSGRGADGRDRRDGARRPPDADGPAGSALHPTLTSPAEADAFVAARVAEGSDFIKIIYDDTSEPIRGRYRRLTKRLSPRS